MKRKMLAFLMAMVLCVTGVLWGSVETRAEDVGEDIDYSYLIEEDALIGYAELQTRGIYLASGNSAIKKISSTTIGAGGTTTAAVKCKVSITSIVERLENGSWVRVTSWTSTKASGYSVMISKSLVVKTGYYYRVRSSHYASSDGSSSCTSALKM